MSAMNHLQRISNTVSLDVARRLFREECEITRAKERQESERTVVGYSQCRNVDKMVNEVSYNDGTGAPRATSYRMGVESKSIMGRCKCGRYRVRRRWRLLEFKKLTVV